MKALLIDHTPFHIAKLSLTEGKTMSDGRMRIRGKLQEAEVKNGNGRVYPKELDHPESSIVNLNNVSHNITKVWWDGNNVMGELMLLNTPSGKIAQELISAGIPLGISSRGMGSVKQIGETVEVQEDFELLCWDLVSVPSTPEAYMKLSEGKTQQSHKDYNKVNNLITEIICNQTGVCPLC